ncbi:conserved hypothetical protein [Acidimicrobium ferrooxidans DSM 10331]|uniref:DUF3054 domain-containing protein n=1 Tax=Acidimicrobium ferrooxidans (strain DSM 10331 / JCM 15462 / NBRC 103882 / ICP) TaxID=525909 RepID=C7LYD4_ACIFD|nr:DUF3054 domain-containing protein [Acidimicrobium ferrooxidans]ACU53742.1 conserved hypothetical protein [Acidimicrobium ferrooxidans DSM 10331]
MRWRSWIAWDIVATLIFVVIGRHAHGHSEQLIGVWRTWWPFLVGTLVGFLLVRRRTGQVWPGGIVVWASTVTLGMVLRLLSHQGVVWLFVAVAGSFLGLFLVGPRLAWALWRRIQPRQLHTAR